MSDINSLSMGPHDGGAKNEFDQAITELLIALGEDPNRDGLKDTPKRVAKAFKENFAGLWQKPSDVLSTTFDIGHQELVIVREIEVFSHCEHHLTPFHGVAHIGYIPGESGRITGLSKLARLVDLYARRPQVQERLTSQIADALVEILQPAGVIVIIDCEHLCMSMRGVRKSQARTTTSAVRGQLMNPTTRAEAISLINQSR
jgi:GTP cyclohydrolase I